MASYSQEGRVFQVETPLADDVLMLKGFRVEDEVSHPFRVALDLLSTREDVDPSRVLRQPMTVRLKLPDGERVIHGIVNRFRQLGRIDELTSYQADIVPWLWFLTLSRDCKIFQNLTVQQIATEVFGGLGYTDYEFRLTRSYGPREYCVQYRETHFNFVSRLLEEEGLFYFFEHADDRHTLVVSDDNSAFEPLPGRGSVVHVAPASGGGEADDVITDLRAEHAILTGRATLSDFDYLKPNVSLRTATIGEEGEEIYDYPGHYQVVKNGETYAEQIVDEHQARTHQVVGVSTVRALQSGYRLKIDGHYRRDLNREYVILSASEQGDAGDFKSKGQAAHYGNRFVAIPWDAPFRPERRTAKPVVSGTQTALVVGPSGEEIYTDPHGRVKVQFHWDRLGKNDENSSCWVRVSYAWAGEGWGAIHIPRIGQEVIVEFLEGDPDRPIVTGRVYNGKQPVPYDLPANKTQSGLKSRSSKEGAAANFNEIRMEDMKGEELLYVHAEKDKEVVVENDRVELVGNDETISIGNNRTESVGKDETITIAENRTESVGTDETISVGGNRTESVGKNESITIGENQDSSVGKSLSVTVGTDTTVSIGKDLKETVGGKYQESVAKEYVLQAKKIQLVAKDEISLKAGKAKMVMKKNGDVTINGKKITIKGSGDVVIKGSKVAQN